MTRQDLSETEGSSQTRTKQPKLPHPLQPQPTPRYASEDPRYWKVTTGRPSHLLPNHGGENNLTNKQNGGFTPSCLLKMAKVKPSLPNLISPKMTLPAPDKAHASPSRPKSRSLLTRPQPSLKADLARRLQLREAQPSPSADDPHFLHMGLSQFS